MSFELEQLPLGESVETDPGVVVERRSFLTVAAAAIAGIAVPGAALARLRKQDDGKLSLEEFLKEVVPLAKKLVADKSAVGQDRYLHTLAAHAVRLREVALPKMRESSQGKGVAIGVHPGGDPFVVLHWRMAPGSRIRSHAHTYGNVVTVGVAGEARVQNFEVVGDRHFSPDKPVRVIETKRQILRPGRTNLVNLEHDYVHGFVAGSGGAQGLDITTRLRERQPTPYLEIGKRTGESGEVREGRWVFD